MKAWSNDPPLTRSARILNYIRQECWREVSGDNPPDSVRTEKILNKIKTLSSRIKAINAAKRLRDKHKADVQ